MRRSALVTSIGCAVAVICIVAWAGYVIVTRMSPSGPIAPPHEIVAIQEGFENVAKAVLPAVVSIQSQKTVVSSVPLGPFGMPGFPGFRVPEEAIGTGSGLIVRPNGYILTNNHVVAGASKVTVQLSNGRQFTGEVRADPRSDLAIVKIPADHLPTLTLANSRDVRVGQWAIAFGSPYGLQKTMTVGVVSAMGRQEVVQGHSGNQAYFYPNLIQTDAAINPGNSGGPLVDIYGQVIGINVAITSPNGGSVGIGFAIPSDTARYVANQLITRGTVTYGFLGFVPRDLAAAYQSRYGVRQGALVTEVQAGSAAAKAGLEVEDVVVLFNGKPIANELDLRQAVARSRPGEKVTITVVRAGKLKTLTALVGSPPGPAPAPPPAPSMRLGCSVATLTPRIARREGLPAASTGAVVVSVTPGGPADMAGLLPGDVVVRINGRPIRSAADVRSAIASLKTGELAAIVVSRHGSEVLAAVTVQ